MRYCIFDVCPNRFEVCVIMGKFKAAYIGEISGWKQIALDFDVILFSRFIGLIK